MKDTAVALPGLERIKARFLALLEERQGLIAHHALAAWEEKTPSKMYAHLQVAQGTLHQIAGTSGSLGFHDLGIAARDCENAILRYLEHPDLAEMPLSTELLAQMDDFVSISQSLLAENA